MTGQPGRLDLARRRRVDRLRVELDLKPVPPYVGFELRPLKTRIREQLQHSLDDERLVAALGRAVDEFFSIVEDRPLTAPPAEVLLIGVVLAEPSASPATVDHGFDVVRGILREHWARLPHASAHAARLDAALGRYVALLCDKIRHARRSRRDHLAARFEGAPVAEPLEEVARRWGGTPVRLCVTVGGPFEGPIRPAMALSVPAPRRPGPPALHWHAADHVLVVSELPSVSGPRGPQLSGPKPAAIALSVGPVLAGHATAAYETALLRLRLVRAGVAAPTRALLPLPALGFLHPAPTDDTVEQIAELLRPLTEQPAHRRVVLARTM